MRVIELKNSKTDLKNKIDALKHLFSHIEEVKEQVKIKIEELKRKFKNLPKENLFDFTEYIEGEQEENEIDLGLFHDLAEENKIVYNQTPVNTPIEDMEKMKLAFLRMIILV